MHARQSRDPAPKSRHRDDGQTRGIDHKMYLVTGAGDTAYVAGNRLHNTQ